MQYRMSRDVFIFSHFVSNGVNGRKQSWPELGLGVARRDFLLRVCYESFAPHATTNNYHSTTAPRQLGAVTSRTAISAGLHGVLIGSTHFTCILLTVEVSSMRQHSRLKLCTRVAPILMPL
jgi:hypothetical protein